LLVVDDEAGIRGISLLDSPRRAITWKPWESAEEPGTLGSGDFEVVLLDVWLPGMDGSKP